MARRARHRGFYLAIGSEELFIRDQRKGIRILVNRILGEVRLLSWLSINNHGKQNIKSPVGALYSRRHRLR